VTGNSKIKIEKWRLTKQVVWNFYVLLLLLLLLNSSSSSSSSRYHKCQIYLLSSIDYLWNYSKQATLIRLNAVKSTLTLICPVICGPSVCLNLKLNLVCISLVNELMCLQCYTVQLSSFVFVGAHIFVYIYICTFVFVYMYLCACVRVYVCMCFRCHVLVK